MKRKDKEMVTATRERTPQEVYQETGTVPAGYHLTESGKVRKDVVRGPKSGQDVFMKAARGYLMDAFGFGKEDIWVARSRRKKIPTLYIYFEGKEIPLLNWDDVHEIVDKLREMQREP